MEQPSHRVDRLVRTVKEQEEAVNLKQGCLGLSGLNLTKIDH